MSSPSPFRSMRSFAVILLFVGAVSLAGCSSGPKIRKVDAVEITPYTATLTWKANKKVEQVEIRDEDGKVLRVAKESPYTLQHLEDDETYAFALVPVGIDGEGKEQDVAVVTPEDERLREIYIEKDGYVVLEAEDCIYSPKWQLLNRPRGYFGDGWLKYNGPNMGVGDPETHDYDRGFKAQGDREDWLVYWVDFSTPGRYYFRAHVTHDEADGDNDAWIYTAFQDDGIQIGDHEPSGDGVPSRWGDSTPLRYEAFKWNGWGPVNCRFFVQEPGVYGFYVAGRSQGFGVDRFVMYLADSADEAMDEDAPVSEYRTVGTSRFNPDDMPSAMVTAEDEEEAEEEAVEEEAEEEAEEVMDGTDAGEAVDEAAEEPAEEPAAEAADDAPGVDE